MEQFWRHKVYATFGLISQALLAPDEKLRPTEALAQRNEPGFRVYRDSPGGAQVQIRGKRGKRQHLYASVVLDWAEVRELRDYLDAMLREVGEQ
jgi:hypothetical protein